MDATRSFQDERLYTLPEIAERTGESVRRLRDAVRAGHLAAHRPGTRWSRVLWADYVRYRDSLRVAPVATPNARDWAEQRLERERLAEAQR